MIRTMRRTLETVIGCLSLWLLWPVGLPAFESPPASGQDPVEQASGPVREMHVSTRDSLITLSFAPTGAVQEKVTRDRANPSDDRAERIVYRYYHSGKIAGAFFHDADGEVVPLRLYAYDKGRLAAEASYHQCRTFSSLHLYTYDDASRRLIEDLQYESRRLWRRTFHYDGGRLDHVRTVRNGTLFSDTSYRYDETGRVLTVLEHRPGDGERTVTTLYRYDDRGHPIVVMQRDSGDPSQDKIDVMAYEYDRQGNWIRHTLIRAVAPVDEQGQPVDQPVEVIERDIRYSPSQ